MYVQFASVFQKRSQKYKNKKMKEKKDSARAIIQLRIVKKLLDELSILQEINGRSRNDLIVTAIEEYIISTKDRLIRSDIIKKTRVTEYDKRKQAREDKLQKILSEFDEVITRGGVEIAVKYAKRGTPDQYISDEWPIEDMRKAISEGKI